MAPSLMAVRKPTSLPFSLAVITRSEPVKSLLLVSVDGGDFQFWKKVFNSSGIILPSILYSIIGSSL